SARVASEKPSIAAFDAVYAAWPGVGFSAAIDDVFTMCEGRLERPMPGTNARCPWKAPQKFTAMIHSKSSTDASQLARYGRHVTPALLTSTAMEPKAS